ncbi:MAG: DUF3604 domain-containing protein [Halioglobus sp.]
MNNRRLSATLVSTLASFAGLMPLTVWAVDDNPLRNVYYGETHMHTAYSLDAFIGGNRQSPSDAYRAAKGETVSINGQPHKLRRPLDFAAVTDHAEYIGEMYSAIHEGAPGYDQDLLKQLRGLTGLEEREAWFFKYVISNNRGTTPKHPEFFAGPETVKSAWKIAVDAADEHNKPGQFTALVAFEWSAAPKGANLHRNVLFRDSNVPDMPASYIDANTEQSLWDWLSGLEKQGMKPLAIPHNSNASKGMMFPANDAKGDPIDKEYAQTRAHFERAIEVMQLKGNSEVHRKFWAADEFADFENADSLANYSNRKLAKGNFIRHAVVKGMAHEKTLGANPFKLAFVGGTDNHNGMMSDVDEDNFVGGHGPVDGTVEVRRTGEVGSWIEGKDLSPGSITAVWATSNTRGAIWDAIYERETFATSGPRMAVRMFGGWNYQQGLHTRADVLEQAYAGGVPMGGDMPQGKKGTAPRFVVMASKDALGANLDRIQIVKGWVDSAGQVEDKVFDVAWSGSRKANAAGKLPTVGNTVNLANATYRNTIGASQLATVWEDPEFDAAVPALYYARVLEIPTPRWSTYDSVRAGLPLMEDVAATIQERAWGSPIWYTP